MDVVGDVAQVQELLIYQFISLAVPIVLPKELVRESQKDKFNRSGLAKAV